ncbi:putative Rho GTPase activation protein [Rosa chinensis]|uniref:Putative Rho GTPase activation protein n=1 Tax=Rosa chinensis TaxID=74649 RepID=A0A2P6SIT1_ROSCH|nr:rho GTPase-activating protein 5 [Rosa chinensis]PRQ58574.1 putative Rho GTPase activation protein [Rosa chinensis]
MARLFRSKSCGLVGLTEFTVAPPTQFCHNHEDETEREEDEEDEKGSEFDEEDEEEEESCEVSTPFLSPMSRANGARKGRDFNSSVRQNNQFAIMDILVAALRKSLITCSVETDDVASSFDISSPTEVRHVSHVTFDRFNGFLGLPTELEPEVPRKAPSASASVFGVSAKSMQCSYDDRGNSVPTILLMMQKRLYSGGGLKAEGIFRINAENSQEERVRNQLNSGVVPHGIDVHCLAGLIKAWFRELPTRILDSLTPEQVMRCNTEDDCTGLVKSLPATEASLLDWALNLMADVAQNEQHNKMNARNIAMVFAPNMTEMADPLTALLHAVQVMNFLKTLILKILREREESAAAEASQSSSKSPNHNYDLPYSITGHVQENLLRTTTMDIPEACIDEKLWCSPVMSDEEEEIESDSNSSPSSKHELECSETVCRSGGYEAGDWLSLRKGVRKLCSHPVFQLSKPAKKTANVGIVNTRGGDGEAWA